MAGFLVQVVPSPSLLGIQGVDVFVCAFFGRVIRSWRLSYLLRHNLFRTHPLGITEGKQLVRGGLYTADRIVSSWWVVSIAQLELALRHSLCLHGLWTTAGEPCACFMR